MRRALIATTLVAVADIQVVPVHGGRTVDLNVRLEPAPSTPLPASWATAPAQGARVEASWTDRNFFNPEGALTLRGIAGTSEQLAAASSSAATISCSRDQVLNAQALGRAPEVRRL